MRSDKRSANQLRPLALTQGLLSRADGSSQWSFGNVQVLASVNGPAQGRIRDELIDRANLEVFVHPLSGLPGPPAKSLASAIASIFVPLLLLHAHPRALIQLTLQTVSCPNTKFSRPFKSFVPESLANSPDDTPDEDDQQPRESAAEKAAGINAASCALMDSGIGMKGLVCAVAIAIMPEKEEEMLLDQENVGSSRIVLDPTAEEERDAESTHVFAFSFGQGNAGGQEGEMCFAEMGGGVCTEEMLLLAISHAQKAAQSIHAFIRKSIETRYTN